MFYMITKKRDWRLADGESSLNSVNLQHLHSVCSILMLDWISPQRWTSSQSGIGGMHHKYKNSREPAQKKSKLTIKFSVVNEMEAKWLVSAYNFFKCAGSIIRNGFRVLEAVEGQAPQAEVYADTDWCSSYVCSLILSIVTVCCTYDYYCDVKLLIPH